MRGELFPSTAVCTFILTFRPQNRKSDGRAAAFYPRYFFPFNRYSRNSKTNVYICPFDHSATKYLPSCCSAKCRSRKLSHSRTDIHSCTRCRYCRSSWNWTYSRTYSKNSHYTCCSYCNGSNHRNCSERSHYNHYWCYSRPNRNKSSTRSSRGYCRKHHGKCAVDTHYKN